MALLEHGIIFWSFAILYTLLEAKEKTGNTPSTIVKAVPALSAVVFVLVVTSQIILFHLLLIFALFFCGLGDIAMEHSILPGLGMFLISHVLFVANFMIHAFARLTGYAILGFVGAFIVLLIYVILYHRYINTAEKPTELLPAVDLYAVIISLTLSSSVMLWLSTGFIAGIIPVIGAISFIISDSFIGIREFHHRFRYDEPMSMITYYLAIFLLSTAALVYSF
ncbi:hypothetical protein EU537_09505 [Candidatus Thorarchaeota archaeon]|nr:MAG: hypothetical protein EU537_09505 [Candidatus Thorarchaeota archaeon]